MEKFLFVTGIISVFINLIQTENLWLSGTLQVFSMTANIFHWELQPQKAEAFMLLIIMLIAFKNIKQANLPLVKSGGLTPE